MHHYYHNNNNYYYHHYYSPPPVPPLSHTLPAVHLSYCDPARKSSPSTQSERCSTALTYRRDYLGIYLNYM